MEGGCVTACVMRKSTVLCLLAFTSLLVQVAESNEQALWRYDDVYFERTSTENGDIKINLPHPVSFSGQKYSVLKVSWDGLLVFGEDNNVIFDKYHIWSSGHVDPAKDKPFIAPLHHESYRGDAHQPADNNQNSGSHVGSIYWEQYSRTGSDETQSDERDKRRFLDYLGQYLSDSSVTLQGTFNPDLYVLVTWKDVKDDNTNFHISPCNKQPQSSCSATFQLVLAANDTTTIAVFNYAKNGIPYKQAHLAGMNGGNGRGWTDVIPCNRSCVKFKHNRLIIQSLPLLRGSGTKDTSPDRVSVVTDVRGRFLFDVTNGVIVRGGCVPHFSKMGYMDAVEVFPSQVEMLGGQIIHVSGPCQDAYENVYCRFDEKAVTQGKVSAAMVGWCPVPRMTSRGRVKLEVSANPRDWDVYTYVIVEPPGRSGRWSEVPAMQAWFQTNPSQLSVTWDAGQLSGYYRDAQDRRENRVDIVLVQYKEQGDKAEWRDLVTLKEDYPNSGSFTFNPQSDIRYTCQEDCDDVTLGLVDIRLPQKDTGTSPSREYISIGPLPLGWYVNRIYTDNIGEDWPRAKCESWAAEQSRSDSWRASLPPCPCSLQQALADWGRFQADPGCNMYFGNGKCRTNPLAKHCVYSVHPTPHAAASYCCYDNDDNLMYSGDSYHGSTSSRAHPWGAAPYNRAGRVPSMSHWLHDLVPYYQCCTWTNDELCQYYTDRRPTKGCRTYNPPGAAIVYGDPHVRTFDGEQYDFGGDGVFWLVNSSHLKVQARFREINTDIVKVDLQHLKPTYISSVAITRDKLNTDVVTFTLPPPDDLLPGRLDVKVNRRHFRFDGSQKWQDFRGLSVINNAFQTHRPEDQNHSNFTVLVKGGAGVQVAERNGLLHVVVVLPPYVKDERHPNRKPLSRGLLGTYDEKRSNEYMTPKDSSLPLTVKASTKYSDFAAKWAIRTQDGSLFRNVQYNQGLPHSGRVDSYTDPNKRPSQATVDALCGTGIGANTGGSQASSFGVVDWSPCKHDYYVTGNRSIAMATKKAQEDFEQMRQSQRKIWTCGWLDIPFAVKDHTDYSVGNTLRVTGCRSGVGSSGSVHGGPTQYTCVQNETDRQPFWEPNEINRYLCNEDTDSASVGMIVGIVVAVVVVIIIIMAVVAFVWYRRRKSKGQRSEQQPSSARAEATMDPGTDETLVKKRVPRVRMSEVRVHGETV